MKIRLGIPDVGEDSLLASRLAQLTLARLVFLSLILVILGRLQLRDVQLRAFSVQVALVALSVGFALAAVYAALLRKGKHLRPLAFVQLVFDQVTWTTLVYVSGGATSGATSLYGLTILTGAILGGLPAAAFAAAVGSLCYVTLVGLMVASILPVPPDQRDVIYAVTIDQAVFPLGINLLVLLVVTLLAGFLAERLRLTGGLLAEAKSRAAKAERLAQLGQVAAGLAHEIRNPLGSIAASIELLRSAPDLTDEDRSLCDIIQRESARLNDLVGDMLDLTRAKVPQPGPTDLGQLAREVVVLASRLSRSGSDVHVLYEGPDAGPVITADASQVRQVLWNLVRNAVQAAAPGTPVTVRVYHDPRRRVAFAVTDEGPGIPESARNQLFDAFFTTRTHGSGIGLAVVKQIVDAHGWSIHVDSGEGKGTSFRVTTTTLA